MLPKLGGTQTILNTRFKRKSDGRFIMAQFYAPRQTATGGVEDPYRIVRASPKSILKAGDVLISGKRKYLIIRGGAEERAGVDGLVFKALELDRTGKVWRTVDVVNDITKRTDKVPQCVGDIDYAATPMRQEEDVVRIQYDHYEFLTDFQLLKGDSLDKNKVVQQVETRLGVTWARMRDV